MISTKQALETVLKTAKLAEIETVLLDEAIGRTLAEAIYADRPMPPFNRVAMDGIAIKYASFEQGQRRFEVEAVGPAGAPQIILKDAQKCIEIMTGASLPVGTDTVIRYEDLVEKDGAFVIQVEVQPDKNIHFKGRDHNEREVLLNPGTTIKAIDINVLATVGKSEVQVYRLPKVAVISSGDELVPVTAIPKDYQIRRSNVFMLQARLKELGIQADTFHLKDDSEAIFEKIKTLVTDYDILMMSGGVSKGKFDFIPEVLDRLGFEKLFHRVAQRPGKPFWYGVKEDKSVFAFPGNPVSTLACFHKYFIPYLYKCLGKTVSHTMKVHLAASLDFNPALTYFAQAVIRQNEAGIFEATVQSGNGSGDLVNPTRMHGFLELPADKTNFQIGEVYDFIPFATFYR